MDNLIDRQAALKELAVYIHLIDKTMGKGTLTDDDCMEAAKSVLGEDELPAVQPATNCSEIPNGSDDTISRQAAIDAIYHHLPSVSRTRARTMLHEVPSVQPEQPPYVAEIEAEYQKAVKMPHIHKPLAKALYEVWKKHDREDAERRAE